MEERERKIESPTSLPLFIPASNGGPVNSVGKVLSPAQYGSSTDITAGSFAAIAAKMMSSKVKGQGASKTGAGSSNQAATLDDLPLGSEAHSLSQDNDTDLHRYPLSEDKRSKWIRAGSQGIVGWQSFNSDVSNQTSASSASLEQLLNDRQVDPEEMLLSLGFGGEPQSLMPSLARVPVRFLHHPSRAYGIAAPDVSENVDSEVQDDVGAATLSPQDDGATSAPQPPPKRRTGIWTLARTLSILRMKSTPSRSHSSPSSNSGGANQPVSILHPANQRYLASRGYYDKQGWPKGSFAEPEEGSLLVVKEEEESRDAAAKRRIFQKSRSRRNWSMCDSGENEDISGGGDWVSKSVDDYRSHSGQDDSLGRGAYFSTTTESSTDSLDTPNLETARAFEDIRREYLESRRQEGSSSEELFLPCKEGWLSNNMTDGDIHSRELDLLNTHSTSTNYFVSPASSRQTTVEKAPTISDQSHSVNLDEGVDQDKQTHSGSLNKSDHSHHGDGEVCIVISSSDTNGGKHQSHLMSHEARSSMLMVESAQTASSDSGSSSGATAVGSSSGGGQLALVVDEVDLPRFTESENSITDVDSISRTNSPHVTDVESISRTNSPHDFRRGAGRQRQTSSNSCQTTDTDFKMAAILARQNRSQLHVLVSKSEVDAEGRKREYTFLEQSPRVQLSTFPASINHLELMKRLQRSQNELSRMGSVQSDSSGFGDADPAVESDTYMVKTSRDAQDEAQEAENVKEESQRYITMCYIPALSSKTDLSNGLRYRGTQRDVSHVTGRPPQEPAHGWRPRAGSAPGHTDFVRISDHFYTRRFRDPEIDHRTHSKSSHHHVSSCRYQASDVTPLAQTDYSDSSRQGEHFNCHVTDTGDIFCKNSYRHSDMDVADCSGKVFTSQIDLYTNAGSFHRKEAMPHSDALVSLRRHSDEGILDWRNDKPLSVELALARSSGVLVPSTTVTGIVVATSATTNMSRSNSTNTPVTTPAHYKTEAGFHYPPIAGNIRGLGTGVHRINTSMRIPHSTTRQKSCDILDDDFVNTDISALSHIRSSVDLDTYSSAAENSSDFSFVSATEDYTKMAVLDCRKLARLINQPIYYRGKRRGGCHYRPVHLFNEWSLLSKRERIQEEKRLLQFAIQKYKTEFSILEASFLVDFQTVYADMTDKDKEEVQQLQWLWNEVKVQVMELEHHLVNRVKSVHAGNEFYSLLANLGVIRKIVELIKEQICHQQMANTRMEEGRDRDVDEEIDIFDEDRRHGSFHSSQSWVTERSHVSTPQPVRRFQSSSTSNLPTDVDISLEQIKSSVMSHVKTEIEANAKKFEQDLQEKDRKIKQLQQQLVTRNLNQSDLHSRRWTPKSSRSQKALTKSRPAASRERVVHETDV